MSGETREKVSPWTIDSLREYMDSMLAASDLRYQQRFDAQEKAVRDALAAAEKAVAAAMSAASLAVTKAEISAEKRLDSVNEFRGQLRDQAATLLPRIEAAQRFGAIESQLERVGTASADHLANSAGKSSITGTLWGVVGAVGGAIIAALIVAFILAVGSRPSPPQQPAPVQVKP